MVEWWVTTLAVIVGGGFLWWLRRRSTDKKRYPLCFVGIQNRSELMERLLEPEFKLAEKIIEKSSASVDLVVSVLDEKSLQFARKLLKEEISNIENESLLFRGNTKCSRVLSTFAVLTGRKYLEDTLGGHIQQIIKSNLDMDVSLTRLAPDADIEVNRKRLTEATQRIFDSIVTSTEAIPLPIRVLSYHLWFETNTKFPQSATKCVGSFFFLRFICPVIMIPQNYGIVTEQPNPQSQRNLTLIAKILQVLANNISFQKREEEMMYFNTFIEKKQSPIY